jgi:hypothetical protein
LAHVLTHIGDLALVRNGNNKEKGKDLGERKR